MSRAEGAIAELARATGLRSSVSAPITVEGKLWGLITASWTGEEPPPPATEERMVKFAGLLGTAVANTDARAEVHRLAEEQAALRRVATLVARATSREEVFTAIAKEIGRLFGLEETRMVRYDDEHRHHRGELGWGRRPLSGRLSRFDRSRLARLARVPHG